MHEATIASNLLDILAERIAQHPNTEAKSITILLGAFRNVEEDPLRFAFDALKEDRPGCSICELIVEHIPLLAKCSERQHLYEPRPEGFYRCSCGSAMGPIIHGQELDVVSCTLHATPTDSKSEPLCTK